MSGIRVAVSGGFDPLTPGHVEYMKQARELGDRLIVIVNTDEFLKRKKGYAFMPLEDRIKIIESVRYVEEVVVCIDEDDTVGDTIKLLKPDIFAKGGDRSLHNLPQKEIDVCKEVGCEIVGGLGAKTHSSQNYVQNLKENIWKE